MDFANEYLMTLPCFLCEKPFTRMDELQKHLNLHSIQPVLMISNEIFTCNICGRNLRSQIALDGHFKRYHEVRVKKEESCDEILSEILEIFECPNCDNVYIQKKYLIDHQQREHSQRREKKPDISKLPAYFEATAPRKYPPRSPYFNPNLWMKNELENDLDYIKYF